jgi:hypothetical protein
MTAQINIFWPENRVGLLKKFLLNHRVAGMDRRSALVASEAVAGARIGGPVLLGRCPPFVHRKQLLSPGRNRW